ncbi:MAG TPA: peptide deformylase [Gemmatimonadales bacterium]|nr:peptide deformylase [Gemmatimonadales bacterium]
MSLLPLHLLGSPVLRERSAEVSAVDEEVRQFVDDLFETMHAAKGVGLAANQVGVARRVAVVETEEEKLVLINPVILDAEGRDTAEEGCLSIPKVYADVTRPEKVVLEATDRDGNRYTKTLDGLAARAVQHEIDHLDGILFVDHLGLLKRKRILSKWKKEHEGDTSFVSEVRPASAGTT